MRGEMGAWFAGPKGENGDWFSGVVATILQDYFAWRRNYFPEDGLVVDAEARRAGEGFRDRFDDRLFELLAKLKADLPFASPRYAAHMVAEQSLAAVAGYFAAMLYNPNNVSADAAPVTVQMELEASRMIATMLGYGDRSWAHLTSGGTVANFEALWMARTVHYLPWVTRDLRREFGLPDPGHDPAKRSPSQALEEFAEVFAAGDIDSRGRIEAYRRSEWNVVEQGIASVTAKLGHPVVLAPETQHYSIKKALDLLGLGRNTLRTVRVDRDFRMDVADLRRRLDDAESAGEPVLAVIPIVGTTEEGAIDPVGEIVALRQEREEAGRGSFWIHADAAYGGYLRTVTLPDRLGLGNSTTRVRIGGQEMDLELPLPVGATCDSLEALAECDSITIDPHKLGYVPYPAGAVCFRSDIVKPLARQDAPYIEDSAGGVEAERRSPNVGVYILEGSKPGAAAAAVWLSHNLIPLDKTGHGKLMQETIRNACELYALLDLDWDREVRAVALCPPGSNIVCFAFRARRPTPLARLNAANQTIYERFTASERTGQRVADQPFFLSRTRLDRDQYSSEAVGDFLDRLGVDGEDYRREGVFLLRSVVMNPWYGPAKRRGRYYLSELVEAAYAAAREVLG